jgi:hypothetical protein
MNRLTEAWKKYQTDHDPHGTSGEIEAAFVAGYRAGVEAQWDASLRDEFNARVSDSTMGRGRR